MNILFVLDDFSTPTNGTVMTAKRMAERLRELGHTVKICAIGVVGEHAYPLVERYIPIVSHFSRKQNTHFAKPDKKVLMAAMEDVDVVHSFLPWKTARFAEKLAKKLGIAYTSSFHTHPDNILYNAGLSRMGFITSMVRRWVFSDWRRFYNKVGNVHCPSKLAFDEMRKYKYKSRPHIISNGVSEKFFPSENLQIKDINNLEEGEFFEIVSVGRYAVEKRQSVILKAAALSKYKDKIRITFAGSGPTKYKLEKLAQKLKLPNYEIRGHINNVKEFLDGADLYVHAAEIEIEGMTAIEAIACGKIAVVANGPKTATKQFAVSDECLFKVNDYKELARKLDNLIANKKLREKLTQETIELSKYYALDHSVQKMEEMFKDAINEKRVELEAKKTVSGKQMNRKINAGFLTNLLSGVLYYGLATPVLFLVNNLFMNLKVKGRKNLREIFRSGSGAVTISNHVHNLDSTWTALANFPHKPIHTALPSNFKLPVAGQLVNMLGAVPIPTTVSENKVFFSELSKKLNNGRFVHVYPEGHLIPYDNKLREFKRGAFQLAVEGKVPIVPMIITYRKRKKENAKPKITITILKPIYPDYKLLKKDAITKLYEESFEAMKKAQEELSR